jgi:hypothetical protein
MQLCRLTMSPGTSVPFRGCVSMRIGYGACVTLVGVIGFPADENAEIGRGARIDECLANHVVASCLNMVQSSRVPRSLA